MIFLVSMRENLDALAAREGGVCDGDSTLPLSLIENLATEPRSALALRAAASSLASLASPEGPGVSSANVTGMSEEGGELKGTPGENEGGTNLTARRLGDAKINSKQAKEQK